MLDAWLNRTRAVGHTEKLVPLPEQEFAAWALGIATRRTGPGLLVTVVGDVGSGKTSLVRQALRPQANAPQRKIAYLPATQWLQFVDEFPDPDAPDVGKNTPAMVVIEDLQSLPSPQHEGDRLAAWIDCWRPAGVSLIVTSDRLPCDIPDLSLRLRNRLQGGLFAGVRPLSADSMHRLWQRWSAEIPLALWQPDRIPPNVQSAGQLKSWAAKNSRSASSASVNATKAVSVDAIAQAVADEFGVSVDALRSGGRALQLRNPRCAAMSLARELTPLSLSTISRYFGCRSHTTVARSGQRLEQLMSATPAFRQQFQSLRTRLRQELLTDCG